MLLTIQGLPRTIKYQELKVMIKQRCGISDFILDGLVSGSDGLKKVRIGTTDDADGGNVLRYLDGYQTSGCIIQVVPVGKSSSNQPPPQQSQQTFNQQGYNQPRDDYGQNFREPMSNQPDYPPRVDSAWQQSSNPGTSAVWSSNPMPQTSYNNYQQNEPVQPSFGLQRQPDPQALRPMFTGHEPRGPPQNQDFNRFAPRTNPIPTNVRSSLRAVDIVENPSNDPIVQPNRYGHQGFDLQNKSMTINRENFQGPQYGVKPGILTQPSVQQPAKWIPVGERDLSAQFIKVKPIDQMTYEETRKEILKRSEQPLINERGSDVRGRDFMGRRNSPSGRRISPGNRRVSPGNRRVSPGNRRVSPGNRRVSPSGRRISPGNRRVSPGNRRVSPSGRRISPGNRHVSPGSRRISPGGRRISPGSRRISPGGRRISPGGRRISPGGRRISPGGRRVSPGNRHVLPGAHRDSPSNRRVSPGGPHISMGGRRISPGGGQMPPGGRRLSPGRRLISPSRRISPNGRRISPARVLISPGGRRMSPSDRRFPPGGFDRRMSPGRPRRSHDREFIPDRKNSPNGNRISRFSPRRHSPGRRSPNRDFNRYSPSSNFEEQADKFMRNNQMSDPSKHVKPAYDQRQASNQAMYTGGHRLNVQHPGHKPNVQNEPRNPWQQDKPYIKKEDHRDDLRIQYEERVKGRMVRSRSPRKSRSPNRRDRSPVRPRHSSSPRRSWLAEKRNSPDMNDAPPPPVWPGQEREEKYQRPMRESDKRTPVWEPAADEKRDSLAAREELERRNRERRREKELSPRNRGFSKGDRYLREGQSPRDDYNRIDRENSRHDKAVWQKEEIKQRPPNRDYDLLKNEEFCERPPQSKKTALDIELEDVHKRAVEFRKKTEELRKIQEKKKEIEARSRDIQERIESKFGKSARSLEREKKDSDRNDRFEDRPSSRHSDDFKRDNEFSRVNYKKDILSPALKAKREKAIDEIAQKLAHRNGLDLKTKEHSRIYEELTLTISRLISEMFGDKDVSFIEVVIKFNAKYDDSSLQKIFDNVMKSFPSHYKNLKRPAAGTSGPSEKIFKPQDIETRKDLNVMPVPKPNWDSHVKNPHPNMLPQAVHVATNIMQQLPRPELALPRPRHTLPQHMHSLPQQMHPQQVHPLPQQMHPLPQPMQALPQAMQGLPQTMQQFDVVSPQKMAFHQLPVEHQVQVMNPHVQQFMMPMQQYIPNFEQPGFTMNTQEKAEEENDPLYLCKDDFEPFSEVQAEYLRKYLVSKMFHETAHNESGWAPNFTIKGLQSQFRYELVTRDPESRAWLLNLDFSDFQFFNVLVYNKEELWYERAAIWLPGHSKCRNIEPLDKLKLQNKKLDGINIEKWKLVKKVITVKGTRLYVDMPPSSARALETHKMLLSYELQKVNVFLKAVAVDKDTFDLGLKAVSIIDPNEIIDAVYNSPMPSLSGKENDIVKMCLKGNKHLTLEQARKVKEMVIYHIFKYHQKHQGDSRTDFISFGFCKPGHFAIVPENSDSKKWLTHLNVGKLNKHVVIVIGADNKSPGIIKADIIVNNYKGAAGGSRFILSRLKVSNKGIKGLNIDRWRTLSVSEEKRTGNVIFHVTMDIESAEAVIKMNSQLDLLHDSRTITVDVKGTENNGKLEDAVKKYKEEMNDSYDVANMDIASSDEDSDVVYVGDLKKK